MGYQLNVRVDIRDVESVKRFLDDLWDYIEDHDIVISHFCEDICMTRTTFYSFFKCPRAFSLDKAEQILNGLGRSLFDR